MLVGDGSGNSSNQTNHGAGFTDNQTGNDGVWVVPDGYVSGTAFAAFTYTITGQSFASFGGAQGDSWTATLGGSGDTITFTAVPEPTGMVLAGLLTFLLASSRRRTRRSV